jgi:hypothetical protein
LINAILRFAEAGRPWAASGVRIRTRNIFDQQTLGAFVRNNHHPGITPLHRIGFSIQPQTAFCAFPAP